VIARAAVVGRPNPLHLRLGAVQPFAVVDVRPGDGVDEVANGLPARSTRGTRRASRRRQPGDSCLPASWRGCGPYGKRRGRCAKWRGLRCWRDGTGQVLAVLVRRPALCKRRGPLLRLEPRPLLAAGRQMPFTAACATEQTSPARARLTVSWHVRLAAGRCCWMKCSRCPGVRSRRRNLFPHWAGSRICLPLDLG
jgi:hypothetical protein